MCHPADGDAAILYDGNLKARELFRGRSRTESGHFGGSDAKNSEVKAVAGFRISEWLAGGKYLEVEDLVAKSGERSKGYGGELFDWPVAHARGNGCSQVRLVSRVGRGDAHRFYLRKGMTLEAHYFSLRLK